VNEEVVEAGVTPPARTGLGWTGGDVNKDGIVVLVGTVLVVVVPVALWKSSKSSSSVVVVAIPLPLPLETVAEGAGTSSSKLNKSTSFFGGGEVALAFDDVLGIEVLLAVARAPPSSNSSYSSYCSVRVGRS